VFDPNDFRKYELECLRRASDCMQLARDFGNPALQSHFVRMAREWELLAQQVPSADIEPKYFPERAWPA